MVKKAPKRKAIVRVPLTLRFSPEEWERIERLADRAPVLSMAALGKAVFLAGLAVTEEDPAVLLLGGKPRGKRKQQR